MAGTYPFACARLSAIKRRYHDLSRYDPAMRRAPRRGSLGSGWSVYNFDDVFFAAISLPLSGMGDGGPWQQRGGARQ
jgi:hypothetical protein